MTASSPKLLIDHFAIAAATLQEGVDYVEEVLGIQMSPGGEHPLMGTHNRLLRLGEGVYLEVIAINPDAPAPEHPRWFSLDTFGGAKPRLVTWVARTENMEASRAMGPPEGGPARTMSRGDLSWQITIPEDGNMPFEGAYPTLIEWPAGVHPSSKMADVGCTLERLTILHPQAEEIHGFLDGHLGDSRVEILPGSNCRLTAQIQTPNGLRELG